ncbi:MAG: tetratricopeptide repeat protein [Terriglobia bacterium]
MRPGRIQTLILSVVLSGLFPVFLWAQMPAGGLQGPGHGPMGGVTAVEKHLWNIFGQVNDFKGEPIRRASVHIDLGYGMTYIRDIQTDAQGRFKTQYELDFSTIKTVVAKLTVTSEGYHSAREIVDFGKGDKTWEIDLVMREDTGGPEDLSEESLVKALGAKLRASLDADTTVASERKDLARGAQELLDNQHPVKAVEALERVVKKRPDCLDCRMLLGLARLDAGSLNSAVHEFAEAAKSKDVKGNNLQRARLNLISGALEDWKGEYDKAAGFLMQAKDQASDDPFILQELGRTLVFQKNWEAADQYLEKAIRAGASPEAMLLRTRALLEEGDTGAAAAQIKDYMGERPAKDFPLPVRSMYTQIQARLTLESETKVSSVVNQPVNTLVAAIPELRGMEPATNQDELAVILTRIGEDVQTFFQDFPNTVSEEQVREERLGKKGETRGSLDEKFQYLLLAQPEKWGLGLEEFRTDEHGGRTGSKGLNAGLMLTSGFASASLLFHPSYQSGATFRLLGKQVLAGHQCYAVAFAQNPAKAQMVERFNADKESVLVLFQGMAWIDASTYKIVRLRSDLLTPQPKIRLLRQTTEITYLPVQFTQIAAAMWLPSAVAVTVEWKGRTFRNSHTYSRFRLFNTEVKDKIHGVEPAPPAPPVETPAGPGARE